MSFPATSADQDHQAIGLVDEVEQAIPEPIEIPVAYTVTEGGDEWIDE